MIQLHTYMYIYVCILYISYAKKLSYIQLKTVRKYPLNKLNLYILRVFRRIKTFLSVNQINTTSARNDRAPFVACNLLLQLYNLRLESNNNKKFSFFFFSPQKLYKLSIAEIVNKE
ncbi:hypothetical protein PUN28_004589 [Cardiocondyla obscurior]|uniref:Uncharacterized protein n=1 Tax=Cardiocondyla obscurior TaxID=286306 RepID=A0AAW2GD89_9HYME